MAKPRLITSEGLAAGAAASWEDQYRDYPGPDREEKQAIGRRLRELGPSPSPAEVATVIGNDSWTEIRCDGCGESVGRAVEVGDERDYESATAVLCVACVREAAALVEG